MPKSKKAKKAHFNSYDRELTQAEVWDDRMLIRSWEEAVKEYEYYHSLAARGVRGEELRRILDQAEDGEDIGELWDGMEKEKEAEPGLEVDGVRQDGVLRRHGALDVDDEEEEEGAEEGEYVEPEGAEVEDGEVDDENLEDAKMELLNDIAGNTAHGKWHGPPLPPVSASIPTTQADPRQRPRQVDTSQQHPSESSTAQSAPVAGTDQTLENLKMAYYWAGYYSGLYDGQRQVAMNDDAAGDVGT